MSFFDENHCELKLDCDIQTDELGTISSLIINTMISLPSQQVPALTRYQSSADNNDDGEADINTKERESVKDIEEYNKYQQDTQDNIPWASSSDIRIVDSDKLPDPNPVMETEGCPECGNIQAYWWIVQTDAGDEPSAQFFRCTKCNHTWRTPKSSL
jgi:DNA-directed RNA polymerase subunit M/transcription elongation factor TFIIS